MKMRKRFAAAITAVVLFAIPLCALGTDADNANIQEVKLANVVDASEGLIIKVLPSSPELLAELNQITDFMLEIDDHVVNYFPDETHGEITDKLDGAADETIDLSDFATIKAEIDENKNDEATMTVKFDTEYKTGQKVCGVVALYNGKIISDPDDPKYGQNEVEWLVLKGEVQSDGSVKVFFTDEQLKKIKDFDKINLGILNVSEKEVKEEKIETLTGIFSPSRSSSNSNLTEIKYASDGFIVVPLDNDDECVTEIDSIVRHILDTGLKPIQYFPRDVIEAAMMAITNVPAEEIQMNEFGTIAVLGYPKDSKEDTFAVFEFVTKYEFGQQVCAIIGIYDGTMCVDPENSRFGGYNVEWRILKAEVLEDGTVKIYFDADTLDKMDKSATTAMGILNEPFTEDVIKENMEAIEDTLE